MNGDSNIEAWVDNQDGSRTPIPRLIGFSFDMIPLIEPTRMPIVSGLQHGPITGQLSVGATPEFREFLYDSARQQYPGPEAYEND